MRERGEVPWENAVKDASENYGLEFEGKDRD